MKKRLLILLLPFFSFAVFGQGFIVDQYSVDIYLRQEGYFDVVEGYDINFRDAKHGIFRDILTGYTLRRPDGREVKRQLVIKNVAVPGQVFHLNSRLEQRTEDKLSIRIGDKDRLVTGLQHYEIQYRVYNALLFENGVVSLYWNLKPTDWAAIFRGVQFKVHGPDGVVLSPENCFVYAGVPGTSSLSTDFDYGYADSVFSGKSHKSFISPPGNAVTVLMQLPASFINENFIQTPLWQRYGWVGIIALLLLIFWRVWVKYGKDDKVIATTSYYPPAGIDPAMAGFLMDDKGDNADLLSLLPYWAALGLITIEEIPKKSWLGKTDMKLTKLGELPYSASDYERTLFCNLFSSGATVLRVSSLQNSFYKTMNISRGFLTAAAQKYYESQSRKVMTWGVITAILLGIILCPVFLYIFSVMAAVSVVAVCVLLAFMCFFMQKKSRAGSAVYSELLGFKHFIKLAELDRIEVLLKDDPKYFEKTMSYALAFGQLKSWAEKFDALNTAPPHWYTSSGANMVGMHSFSRSFSDSISRAQSVMISSPSSSSSGGGSSGGGFGGGGGGSW